MSRLFERLNAHTRGLSPHSFRKHGEEIREVIRLLEDALASIRPGSSAVPATTIINNNSGGGTRLSPSYPLPLFGGEDLFPGGLDLGFGRAVKITKCEMHADPAVTASASTTFTLQNQASSPTSTGTVTFALGSRVARSLTLGVRLGSTERLHLIAPAAVNGIQGINTVNLEWELE